MHKVQMIQSKDCSVPTSDPSFMQQSLDWLLILARIAPNDEYSAILELHPKKSKIKQSGVHLVENHTT